MAATSVCRRCFKRYIEIMKRVGTIAVFLAGGLVLGTSLRAQDEVVLPGNPYAVVVVRNIFGLNPPVKVDPNAIVVEPPVKIVPNGIMSIFGQLQVLFKVAAKPGGKDASYMLMEGQSQDEIEVVKINEKGAIVTFNNHGIMQELPLVVTAPSATPSMPTGGNPLAPGIVPGVRPSGNTGNNPFMTRFGNRSGIPGSIPSKGNNNSDGGNDGAGLSPVSSKGVYQPPVHAQVDAAAAAAQILINTELLKSQGDPKAALMPPIPGFSPEQ